MPINLVPQDYQQVGDTKGRRKKVRPDNLNSGTLYGQYQLRGSILTIKDSMDAVSGYMAFGTDMTTIPTGASAGTGIYIDYTGIYGLASNVQQAYMRASDGKIVAGAGAVTLDVNGITLALNNSNPNFIKWGGDSGALFGSAIGAYITANTYYTRLHSIGGDVTNHAGTLHLFAQDAVSTKSAAIDLIGNTSNGFIQIYSTDGIMVGATGAPLALLHLKSTAPTFRMEDSTASAKSLLVTTDANLTKFEEAGGAASNLLVLDLANARVGINYTSPSHPLSFGTGLGAKIGLYDTGSGGGYGFGIQANLLQIFANEPGDRVGIGYGNSASFTETLSVKSSGVGIGTTSPAATTLTLGDAYNIVVGSTTGTKIGTATTQKLGFFNATPVVQQANTTDLGTVLSNLGLRASGTAYPITTSGAVTLTGGVTISTADLTITDRDVVLGTTTGTKFGTSTSQKLSFYNATPIVRPSAYTQTYSTADKTHANFTSSNLTGITSSSTGSALAEPSASYTQSQHQQNYRRIQDQFVNLRADVADLKQLVNSVIDDLQALGLVA